MLQYFLKLEHLIYMHPKYKINVWNSEEPIQEYACMQRPVKEKLNVLPLAQLVIIIYKAGCAWNTQPVAIIQNQIASD